MSKLFEALCELETESPPSKVVPPAMAIKPELAGDDGSFAGCRQESKTEQHALKVVVSLAAAAPAPAVPDAVREPPAATQAAPVAVQSKEVHSTAPAVLPDPRLVALTNPSSLGAEKFRTLATRLDYLRKHIALKCLQITSCVANKGKTVVAGNLAITFTKYSGSKILLVEGNLRRPGLGSLFGLADPKGIGQWWSEGEAELGPYVQQLNDTPLWLLPAGKPCEQPSDVLRSSRFQKAFADLAGKFEWVFVDSPPMLPTVDVNLWSNIVDGTLLVVREGVTPIAALKRGLKALDQPKLIGVVVNDAIEFDQLGREHRYSIDYGRTRQAGQ